jgi:hypothetical protein
MPFVPVPNTALVEMRMLLDAQQVENTLYFDFGATPVIGDLTSIANAMITWWESAYSTAITTSVELREVVATDLSSATGPQVSISPAVPAFGDLNDAPLPNNVTLTVSFRTANRGRSFRGRNYVVGLGETQVAGNTVAPSVITAFDGIYSQLLASPVAAIATWVVVSRFSGVDPVTGEPIPRVTGIATPIISVTVVDNVVDSQRRRLPKRGQ